MKRKFTFLIALLFIGSLNAQEIKERLTASHSATGEAAFTSMGEIAKNWSDGSYFKRAEYSGMYQPQGKEAVKFNKDEAGEISSIEIGSKTYEAGTPTGLTFVVSYYNGQEMLYLNEATIVEYRMYNSNITIKNIWGAKLGLAKAKKEIAAFREFVESEVESLKGDLAAEQKAERDRKEAERKATYGLEDKEVAKVEVINLVTPEFFGHFVDFSFDLKTTLKDGTVITTEGNNQGYKSDYVITYENVTWDDRGVIGGKFIEGDKIVVNVALKKDPSTKTSLDVVVPYNINASFSFNGLTWSRGNGESAKDYRIEVKQVKHAVNGNDILKIRIYTGSSLISEFSIGVDQTLYFNCKGGGGGTDDGRGSDGGNGGNLVVIKDPSVKSFNLNYDVSGGRGGKGANSAYDGRDGRDGTFKEEVRAVNF